MGRAVNASLPPRTSKIPSCLGLRIREGLDTRQFSHLIPEQKWIELEHDWVVTTMLDGRAIPTLRGRLLNDTIITELLETLD